MVGNATEIMSDDARALQQHFDGQLAGLRGMVEALASRVESHHTTQVTQIGNVANTLAGVEGAVKAQNGRVTRGEDAMIAVQGRIENLGERVAVLEGKGQGGSTMLVAICTVGGLVVGVAGAFIAVAMGA